MTILGSRTSLRRLMGTVALTCSLLLPAVSNAQVWTLFTCENCIDLCDSACVPGRCPSGRACPPNPAGQPCDLTVDDRCWDANEYVACEYYCSATPEPQPSEELACAVED